MDPSLSPIQLELEIDHRDDDGQYRSRQLSVRYFALASATGPARLVGHCSISGHGEFHSDRISRCRCLTSGETITDLPRLLVDRFARSREGRLEALWRQRADELAVLLAMAHGDSLLQSREKELIATYLQERQPHTPGAETLSRGEITLALRWLVPPDRERFLAAVEALAGWPPEPLADLHSLCVALADVRQAREGDEQTHLDLLQARWFGGA